MKVKILAQLKAMFPGVQNDLLDRVASRLEKTITKEEDIETAVKNSAGLVEEFSSFMQSEADRRVTAAVQKREAELKAEFEKKLKDPGKPDDPKPDDVPAWAKQLIEQNKTLAEKVNGFETAGLQKSLSERLVQQLSEKKIPAKYYSKAVEGRTFKDETEMQAYAASIESEYTAFNQELIDSGMVQQQQPVMGGQNKDGVSTVVQSFVEGKKLEQEGKTEASSLGGKSL